MDLAVVVKHGLLLRRRPVGEDFCGLRVDYESCVHVKAGWRGEEEDISRQATRSRIYRTTVECPECEEE
jgi:hypothetical protein